jgi:hypothetical protein
MKVPSKCYRQLKNIKQNTCELSATWQISSCRSRSANVLVGNCGQHTARSSTPLRRRTSSSPQPPLEPPPFTRCRRPRKLPVRLRAPPKTEELPLAVRASTGPSKTDSTLPPRSTACPRQAHTSRTPQTRLRQS